MNKIEFVGVAVKEGRSKEEVLKHLKELGVYPRGGYGKVELSIEGDRLVHIATRTSRVFK